MSASAFNGVLGRVIRNRRILIATALLVIIACVALASKSLAPFDPLQQNLRFRLMPPGSLGADGRMFLLGTDQFGRDAFSRILVGARVPLIVSFSAALLGAAIGLLIGVIAGYFQGWIDSLIGLLIDAQLSIPFVLVGMMVVVLFGPSLHNIVLVFTLLSWPIFARIARDEARLAARQQFVEASLIGGGTTTWILLRHIIPAALPRVIVVAAIQLAYFVVSESAFGFFRPRRSSAGTDVGQYLVRLPQLSVPGVVAGFVPRPGHRAHSFCRQPVRERSERSGRPRQHKRKHLLG